MRGRLLLLAPFLAGALVAPPAAAAAEPPDGQFSVQAIAGTGCRPTNTQVRLRDLSRVDVSFAALQAQQGRGVPATSRRSTCIVSLRAPVVRGYTFGVDNVLLRGRATLPPGAGATARAGTWFVGLPRTETTDRELTGPFDAIWDLRRVVRPGSISWAPCGRNTPVNLQVDVSVTGRPGVVGRISMDAGTNEPSASYRFAWKRC
ncbi:hypothetical protein CryarDRAFT_3001 [Cryptosporangium arvum DSM 44712]|uniref:DUF4360 domain-containing protein n=2 Tax=Cryptosporangium TaxID=65502 RepID=A0A010YNY0_9ACTN|nr:hypothetical protein CryarDRAFT_3001 [Cryptosporangium arvum DSM 44712]